jgi:hypothetical protein
VSSQATLPAVACVLTSDLPAVACVLTSDFARRCLSSQATFSFALQVVCEDTTTAVRFIFTIQFEQILIGIFCSFLALFFKTKIQKTFSFFCPCEQEFFIEK